MTKFCDKTNKVIDKFKDEAAGMIIKNSSAYEVKCTLTSKAIMKT